MKQKRIHKISLLVVFFLSFSLITNDTLAISAVEMKAIAITGSVASFMAGLGLLLLSARVSSNSTFCHQSIRTGISDTESARLLPRDGDPSMTRCVRGGSLMVIGIFLMLSPLYLIGSAFLE